MHGWGCIQVSKWNLRNYEIFAHRGYDGTNTLQSFDNAVLHGYHVECDIVQTADGTVFINHDRSVNDNGTTVYVAEMTDAVFRTYFPNQPTASEFITWMQNNPNTLASISPYQGINTFLAQCVNAGIDDRIIFDCMPNEDIVSEYPRVSWCVPSSNVTTNEGLDKYRTPLNIVSSDECEDNSNGEFPIMRQWSQCGVNELPSLIAKGVTWFCPSGNGVAIDDFAEALKEYTPPNYSNSFMINECVKALRSKNSKIGDIYGRNIPSEIRKLKVSSGDTDVTQATSLTTTQYSNTQGASLRGLVSVNEVIIDVNGFTSIGGIAYVALSGENGGKVVYKNCSNVTSLSDMLRNAMNIRELEFEGGIYPTTITRLCQYFGNESSLSFVTQNFNAVTIKGIHLDNLTSVNYGVGASLSLNILWEGTLKESLSFINKLTSDSVNALVSCLADYSSGEQHTLTLGTNNLPKVTEENLALATSRNWVLA